MLNGDDLGFQFNGHDKEKREFSLLVAVRGKLIVTNIRKYKH